MQRFQPQQPCNCLDRTAQALNCFPNISTISSLDTHQMSLDEVLSIGTALVEHWELLHGCPVTETHLDARMLQTMIDAVIKTLTLYEVAVGSILGGWGENQEPNGVGIDKSNNPPSTRNGSRDRSVETKPAVVVTEATAHLGNMQLDSHEMTVVAREALRHATMRLGEMLHDIEEDMSILRDRANPSQRNDHHVGEVRQITSRLLRILGRINSNDGNMNEE
ncbi:hypothetical protein N7499_005939 [Penicillium canescens]|nr:uncharacterized protein N7446_001711 [Penicillium canescens]KAJ6054987.1 hypothetical protein N7444_004085 [Penicillium canescens]KAJ6073934.1 hypothetical protein N7446_001711 [Penicillium canescens]KAJ6081065.1 hypothetical protein N7499_005939 [Penicillium canescens]KAJ6177139.1 hypothetical protein N7485_004053 [Penicillium canescens]